MTDHNGGGTSPNPFDSAALRLDPAYAEIPASTDDEEAKAQTHPGASVPLDTLAGEINATMEKAAQAESKGKDFRITAGLKLKEAKERVQAGEVPGQNWRQWVQLNIMKSYRDANRCIALVSSSDPAAAREAEKAATKAAVSKHREKSGTYVSPKAPDPMKGLAAGSHDLQRVECADQIKWHIAELRRLLAERDRSDRHMIRRENRPLLDNWVDERGNMISPTPALQRAKRANVEGRPYLLDVLVVREGIGAASTWYPPFSVADLRSRKV